MNTILKTVVLLFCTTLFSSATLTSNETVRVKTFLVTTSERNNIEFGNLWENDFILKYQWEPEGLYIITKLDVTKGKLDDVFQKFKITYSIEDPKIRELPKKMFNKL